MCGLGRCKFIMMLCGDQAFNCPHGPFPAGTYNVGSVIWSFRAIKPVPDLSFIHFPYDDTAREGFDLSDNA